MDDLRLTVFLSSRMRELHNERMLLKQMLQERGMQVFAFEVDAGARPESPQVAYLSEVRNADVYVGLFWNEFSEAVFEEFECAQSLGKPCFIYTKSFSVRRDKQLREKLQAILNGRSGLTAGEFSDVVQLSKIVGRDLQNWLIRDWRSKCEMSDVLRRRMQLDADALLDMMDKSETIGIDRIVGWPPVFHLRYHTKGIVRVSPHGQPFFSHDHRVCMEVHNHYPSDLPFLKVLTPLFHPMSARMVQYASDGTDYRTICRNCVSTLG
jgi:hypothetical protein